MRRALGLWIVFGICLALGLGAMAWTSALVLRFERQDLASRSRAASQENLRLALWRMDSALANLVAQENARPYFAYTAFFPAERAYTRMFGEIRYGDVLVPSPLLNAQSSLIFLHFQVGPDQKVTSPQAPEGNMRDLAAGKHYATRERLLDADGRLEAFRKRVGAGELALAFPAEQQEIQWPAPVSLGNNSIPQRGYRANGNFANNTLNHGYNEQDQIQRGQQEYQARQANVLNASNNGDINLDLQQKISIYARQQQSGESAGQAGAMPATRPAAAPGGEGPAAAKKDLPAGQGNLPPGPESPGVVPESSGKLAQQASDAYASFSLPVGLPPGHVREGVMKPLWLGDALLLVRHVRINDQDYVQGAWLNWEAIKASQLELINDVLPGADLVAASGEGGGPHLLASLPARLVAGEVAMADGPWWTWARVSLAVAWSAAIVGAAAVGTLVGGAMLLSNRRAAFVSAVTHELRTPLTTVSMYAEMLESGMVSDESRRIAYLSTLRTEAKRLGHLVENVLAYSRIERGAGKGRVCEVNVVELVERSRERLEQRLATAAMSLQIDVDGPVRGAGAMADESAVEQILFNLVDNACKYARGDGGAKVFLTAARRGRKVTLSIADEGPGISKHAARRLFKPFSKSAETAAVTAPGVGLGLALSRRLARAMGGDLRLEPRSKGACFVLILPAV